MSASGGFATDFTQEGPHAGRVRNLCLELCRRRDLNIDLGATSFFLSRRSLKTAARSPMPRWQEKLFIWLAGAAEDASEYFHIPANRVVEVGTQIAV